MQNSTLYNYADDNTLSHSDPDPQKVVSALVNDSSTLIDWFSFNRMKANPSKFQAIAVGKKSKEKIKEIKIESANIQCEDEVKLLGITLVYKLGFNKHITNICKKASK